MRKIAIFIILSVVLASCMLKKGSGNIITQTKTVSKFTGINISGGFEVEIKNGATENVVVEADDNLMKYVDVNVVGDELKVRLEQISVSDAHLKILITAPQIDHINASAGSDITTKDQFKSASPISVKASSGSDIKANLDAPEVKAEVSSGGEITLSGRTKDLHATSASGSSITASELLSENSYVSASSGGSVHVYASVKVEAKASSGGDVYYKGGAPSVVKEESSGGNVQKDE